MFPVPRNEVTRLQRVLETGILDSAFETQFDALVMHASEIFSVPTSLITILDRDRQWFKAIHGFDRRQTDREFAFCNYPVATGSLVVVEDATQDDRFSSNPFVMSENGIRFYAGVPLAIEPGVHVGTLCILDTKVRRLSPTAIGALQRLGHVAEALIMQFNQARQLSRASDEIAQKNALLAQKNAELVVKQQLLEDACRLASMGAWERDLATGKYRWSESLYALHGIRSDVEITDEYLRRFYDDGEWAKLTQVVQQAYKDNSPYEIELEFLTANNEPRHARICSAVEFGSDGSPVRRFGLKQDITVEKEARKALRKLAEFDPLTGLLNRASLLARMEEQSSQARPICLMLLDLDGFKDVNDTSGHNAGDACLREIARRLRSIPAEASVARVGGDEFALLFEASDLLEMEALAAWILREVAQPCLWDHQGFQLGVSIGIAHSLDRPGADPEMLLTQADLALYAAKANGKNLYEFFVEELRSEATRKVNTIRRARAALKEHAFVLHYQPKIDLSGRKLVGLEALLRWQDGPSVQGPSEFRAALDDTVLCTEIGAFVLAQAIRQAGEWVKAGVDFGHVSINMSPQQFRNERLVDELLDDLALHGLSPRHIQLEITEETVLSRSANEVRAVCSQLRQEGVRIAFDDFGTGFASLTHLIEFPVDIIKIDRNFIKPLAEDARARSVVASIVGLARNLDLAVVAEGVETEEQRELLLAMGCNVAQGYLFAPAVPSGEIFPMKMGVTQLGAGICW
jgi:diguanylate cyclase (GGDEF)-like protein